ncbi:alpha/beta hydrolase [Nocardioides pacificus]
MKLRGVLPLSVCALLLAGTPVAVAGPGDDPVVRPGTTQRAAPAQAGDIGVWDVVQTGVGEFAVSWTSPRPLPITSSRPQIVQRLTDRGETDLGATVVAENGRTVTVTVAADRAPDTSTLDVVLSGRTLDGTSSAPQEPDLREVAPTAPEPAPLLDIDPGVPGDLAVTTSDYTLDSFAYPGMKGALEMVGHVVRPADGQGVQDAPLVLFLHGRHNPCYSPKNPDRYSSAWPCDNRTRPVPSQLGYDYIQRVLASQGYATVSVAANGINAQDGVKMDGGAAARAELVRRHLDQWATWAADDTMDVDPRNVILVGHSRGGEGVNRASQDIALTAPYRVTGQVLLAPTNFARQTAAYVPTVTVLPYCDGDVIDLQGQIFTDIARDLTSDDTSLRSTALVMGANHNFFNTEWTPRISAAPSFDDWGGRTGVCGRTSPTRLRAPAQRKVGKAYVAGAVQLMTGRDARALAMFDGTHARVASAGAADVRTHAIGAGRRMVAPGADATLAPSEGARTQLCKGLAEGRGDAACGRFSNTINAPHWVPGYPRGIPWTRAFEMAWTAAGQSGGLLLRQPLDLSDAASLDLRTIVDPSLGNVRLGVRVTDAAGASVVVAPEQDRLLALPRDRGDETLGKHIAQTVRVPVAALTGIDVAQVARVDLVGNSPDGRVWVLDLGAVPAGPLAAAPDKRLAQVNFGTIRQQEGDSGEAQVVVPFRVSGTLTEPARFVALVQEQDSEKPRRVVVDLAPGATTGGVELRVVPNLIDDLDVRWTFLQAFALRGAMPSQSIGRALILDDDPTPRVRVRTVPRSVTEGGRAIWRLTLSAPTGYDVYLDARFVAGTGPGPRLSVGDVPRGWMKETFGLPDVPAGTPLLGRDFQIYRYLPAGTRNVVVKVPLRRDGVREPTERVTLRFRSSQPRFAEERTVRVRDASK